MTKKTFNKKVYFVIPLLIVGVIVSVVRLNHFSSTPISTFFKPSEESFKAPGKNWQSPKKVEDYFIEHLHMNPLEAKNARLQSYGNDGKINLRLLYGTKLPALLSNLKYYGFIRDEKALEYALEHTKDTFPGRTDAIKIGNNTIDIYSSYRISEDMTAWEIADQLLNHPSYFAYDEYGYMFMP